MVQCSNPAIYQSNPEVQQSMNPGIHQSTSPAMQQVQGILIVRSNDKEFLAVSLYTPLLKCFETLAERGSQAASQTARHSSSQPSGQPRHPGQSQPAAKHPTPASQPGTQPASHTLRIHCWTPGLLGLLDSQIGLLDCCIAGLLDCRTSACSHSQDVLLV